MGWIGECRRGTSGNMLCRRRRCLVKPAVCLCLLLHRYSYEEIHIITGKRYLSVFGHHIVDGGECSMLPHFLPLGKSVSAVQSPCRWIPNMGWARSGLSTSPTGCIFFFFLNRSRLVFLSEYIWVMYRRNAWLRRKHRHETLVCV